MSYYLLLSDDRTLILNFYFSTLAVDVDQPSTYFVDMALNFSTVSLYEMYPQYIVRTNIATSPNHITIVVYFSRFGSITVHRMMSVLSRHQTDLLAREIGILFRCIVVIALR